MILLTPLRPAPGAFLAAANPVAKLGSAAVLMAILFVSVDGTTAAVVLAGLAAATALSGLPLRALLARTWPLLVAALSVGILNTLFAAGQAGSPVNIGPLTFGSQTLLNGFGLGLRLLGIAYAGVLAMATTDPTDLADSLVEQLRLSPRFAVGALAAARLIPILAMEWQTISMARRARGLDAGRSPIAAVRLFLGRLLGLLVAAIRRGTRLALAMESRGFGAMECRTTARDQPMRAADWWLIAAAAGLGGIAVSISLASGSWRFLFG